MNVGEFLCYPGYKSNPFTNFKSMKAVPGKYIIFAGAIIMVIGILVYFFYDKLYWIGRLPGDIRIEKEHFSFYLPITTMIIFGLIITLLIRLFKKV